MSIVSIRHKTAEEIEENVKKPLLRFFMQHWLTVKGRTFTLEDAAAEDEGKAKGRTCFTKGN